MLVFIREIPESVTRQDLRHFVGEAFRSPWNRLFGRKGEIRELDILKITDEETQTVEYHGLVDIEPSKSAMLAIRRLNKSRLLGRSVDVRRYWIRSTYRDRRGQPQGAEELSLPERRMRDRRRPRLREERVHVSGPVTVASDSSPWLTVVGEETAGS
ncbi:MAG TPA: RNA-binding protein [Sedimenticola thiotaurini]|uniref:RNA-binding protein n=1 Tax=Sedimenticola thiotaurini TaxID=1543721 RepID=A0A831W8H2_9GAMM|nr:RNA-binding protein [Sedimenticola thiotaurini]